MARARQLFRRRIMRGRRRSQDAWRTAACFFGVCGPRPAAAEGAQQKGRSARLDGNSDGQAACRPRHGHGRCRGPGGRCGPRRYRTGPNAGPDHCGTRPTRCPGYGAVRCRYGARTDAVAAEKERSRAVAEPIGSRQAALAQDSCPLEEVPEQPLRRTRRGHRRGADSGDAVPCEGSATMPRLRYGSPIPPVPPCSGVRRTEWT